MSKRLDKKIPEIIDDMHDQKPHRFWDRHPVLNDAKAFLLCTAGAFLIAFVIIRWQRKMQY